MQLWTTLLLALGVAASVGTPPVSTLNDILPARPLRTLDGSIVNAASLKGRIVLVDVWATWCAPCLAELPRLKSLHKTHRDTLSIVGISADSLTTRELKQWLRRRDVAWPQVFDGRGPDGPLFTELGIVSLPRTFLFDRNGRLVAQDVRGETLTRAIAALHTESVR